MVLRMEERWQIAAWEREAEKEKTLPGLSALPPMIGFNKHVAKLYDYESSRKRRKAPGASG